MSEVNSLSNEALVAEVEARRDELSPDLIARLSAVAAVQKARGDVGNTVAGGQPNQGNGADKAADAAANLPDLSPEQMAELLAAMEHNFNNHPDYYEHRKHLPRLEQNVTFAEVQTCLENDPALAKQVYAMHKRCGRPDVWSRYGKSLLFFESVRNTTPASRDCVYGEAQAEWLRKNRPSEPFNGSVEKQREAMGGVGVTAEQMWQDMQKLGPFTDASWEWTYSDDINDDSPTGDARRAFRFVGRPRVRRNYARYHNPFRGWRAVAKGSEA